MTILKSLRTKTTNWFPKDPASEEDVQQLLEESRLNLPEIYLEFLRHSNGGEGDIPVQPLNAVVWPAQDVIENNRGYGIQEFVPGFFAFGSNGGGEMLAFDTRTAPPWKIYAIPFIGDENDAMLVADSFEQLVQMIGHSHDPKTED